MSERALLVQSLREASGVLLAPGYRTLLSLDGPTRVALPWTFLGPVIGPSALTGCFAQEVVFFDQDPRWNTVLYYREAGLNRLSGDVMCLGQNRGSDFFSSTFTYSSVVLQSCLVGAYSGTARVVPEDAP